MPLAEQKTIGSINVTANGMVEIREDTHILRDGEVIAGPNYHRHVLAPGDDVSGEDARVQSIAAAVWTPDVIAAYQLARAQSVAEKFG